MKCLLKYASILVVSVLIISCDGIGASKHSETLNIHIDGTVTEANVTLSGCEKGDLGHVVLPYSTDVEVQHGERCRIKATNTTESGVIKISVFNLAYSEDDIGIAPNGYASITYRPGID